MKATYDAMPHTMGTSSSGTTSCFQCGCRSRTTLSSSANNRVGNGTALPSARDELAARPEPEDRQAPVRAHLDDVSCAGCLEGRGDRLVVSDDRAAPSRRPVVRRNQADAAGAGDDALDHPLVAA